MAVQKNFKIVNGLEVNTNLIFADTDSNKVGIATTGVRHTLHVNGGIGATSLIVSGISTLNNLTIDGRITAGSSLGVQGQYLISTGGGVSWANIPKLRQVDNQVAAVNQTTFNTLYAVGLLDVYVNGVRLSEDEFTAVNGATVTLDDACFGGETVEFISYSPSGVSAGYTGISGLTILEEGTPIGSPLQVTSINFVGAAVTAVGSGIGVTVYLSDYIGSSGVSTYASIAGIASASGIATFATSSGIATFATNSGVSTFATSSGIATFATNSGISTVSQGLVGTPNIQVGIVSAVSVTIGAATTQLIVTGDARITGILTIGTSSITLNGATNTVNVGSGVTIDGTAGTISATTFVGDGSGLVNVVGSGSGIVVLDDGSTVGTAGTIDFGANLSVSSISSGIVTVTASGGTSTQWETTDVGIHTLSSVGIGTTNPTSALTVVGSGASISQLYVTGVSTFRGTNNTQVHLGNPGYAGVSWSGIGGVYSGNEPSILTNSGLGLDISGGIGDLTLSAPTSGGDVIIKAGNFSPTAINCVGNAQVELYNNGSKKFETLGTGVTVTGTTFTNQLNVSGVSTFSGNVRVGVDTSTGVILTSPNGTQYRLIVADNGTLNTVAV
jgi:hypothetical protein